MAVALDATLRTLAISTLIFKGQWARVTDRKTKALSTDIFIGAAVTEHGESSPDIDLCSEVEPIHGFVIGLVPQLETIPALGPWFNDEDNPFTAGLWIHVGVPRQGMVILVCSDTNKTINRGDKIKCVDGVWQQADTNDNYQMYCRQPIVAAPNTRKYFYAEWVKN